MESKPKVDLLITGASQLLTCVPVSGDLIGRIANGAIAIAGERIVAVGAAAEVESRVDAASATRIDAAGKIVAPGFVDCHTHLVFGGLRAQEYAAKMTRTAAEVQALGIPTGILATVDMTRAESVDSLIASAADRLKRMVAYGTTTVESKSGYGLTLPDELKMLEVNRRLQASQPVDVLSTFLGAHGFPRDLPPDRYVEIVINEMIPQVAENLFPTMTNLPRGYPRSSMSCSIRLRL